VGTLRAVKDKTGQPKLDRNKKPREEIAFGVAFPKNGIADWKQTDWGKQVLAIGMAAFPQMYVIPAFAWKVTDGDSLIPNKRGKVPSKNEGYPGCHVVWFSQGWVPKLRGRDGVSEMEVGAFTPGNYVQVIADVAGNGATGENTPGVYMNPQLVGLAGYGTPIHLEEEVDTTGFGQAPLPAGATEAPVGGFPAGAGVASPSPASTGTAALAPTSPSSAPQVPVKPNTSYMAPPLPPAKPSHAMTALAQGATYEAMIASGWTDALLVEHGMMVV
jgi:hypothetical protein